MTKANQTPAISTIAEIQTAKDSWLENTLDILFGGTAPRKDIRPGIAT